jgi:predicted metal-dependent hydrolase
MMDRVFFNGVEIKYKIVKKPIKHIYLRVDEGFVEVRANRFVPVEKIEKFILDNAHHIIRKLQNQKYYFFLGKKYFNNGVDLKSLYMQKTPEIVLPLVYEYSNKMNLHPSRVSFRFNKTRWGSCSYKNSIVFNYYLAKLPEDVIEYVVVHELAHIRHKNHQKNFWALVGEFLPDFKKRLKKLREIEKEF